MGACLSSTKKKSHIRFSRSNSYNLKNGKQSSYPPTTKLSQNGLSEKLVENKDILIKIVNGTNEGIIEEKQYREKQTFGDEKNVILLNPKERVSEPLTEPQLEISSNQTECLVKKQNQSELQLEFQIVEDHALHDETVVELVVDEVDVTSLMEGLEENDEEEGSDVSLNSNSSNLKNGIKPELLEKAENSEAVEKVESKASLQSRRISFEMEEEESNLVPSSVIPKSEATEPSTEKSSLTNDQTNDNFTFFSFAEPREMTKSKPAILVCNETTKSKQNGQVDSVVAINSAERVIVKDAQNENQFEPRREKFPLPLTPVRYSNPFSQPISEAGDQEIFDPELLATYEETFKSYSADEWKKNNSSNPRRVSLEYWKAAERKLSKRLSI